MTCSSANRIKDISPHSEQGGGVGRLPFSASYLLKLHSKPKSTFLLGFGAKDSLKASILGAAAESPMGGCHPSLSDDML